MCHGQTKLDRCGLIMKHWLSYSFLIIYNRFWLSIIPVIWLKGFSRLSYLGEIQASFFASVLSDCSFRHTSCKIEHCTGTSSKLKRHENKKKQQCKALVQQIKQPLKGRVAQNPLHFLQLISWEHCSFRVFRLFCLLISIAYDYLIK